MTLKAVNTMLDTWIPNEYFVVTTSTEDKFVVFTPIKGINSTGMLLMNPIPLHGSHTPSAHVSIKRR